MDDVQQLTGTIADALRTIGLELTSVRLLIQFGLILLAAIVGTLTASLVRRRIDLMVLTLGWPPFLREFARLLVANLGTIIFVLLVATMHAVMLSLIIVGHRTSSDALERLVRTEPLNIAAEMQWSIMPPRTYADGRVVISASLEPAHRISGDVFEYAIDGPLVHLTILDSMGHDTAAGLCGVLALSACRTAQVKAVKDSTLPSVIS